MGIKLENISLSFGDKVIFRDFCYDFPDRGVTCVMGPSGRGKTSLLRMLCGLQKPDSGSISGCQKAAVLFQEDRLFPWLTAGGNIEAVMDDGSDAKALLRQVKLEGEYDALPDSLSGGMTRRIAFARALAYGGDALLLDEPLTGLDEALQTQMRRLIAREAEAKPVIMVTHSEEDPVLLNAQVLRL